MTNDTDNTNIIDALPDGSKVLGVIDHVFLGYNAGGMTVNEVVMVLEIKTYIYGDYKFAFKLDKMREYFEKLQIPDITILYDMPCILVKRNSKLVFDDICPTRRV